VEGKRPMGSSKVRPVNCWRGGFSIHGDVTGKNIRQMRK
jgi:prolipoprotein diacylglyceryltransferase